MGRIRSLVPCHSATITMFEYGANQAVIIVGETDDLGQPTDARQINLIQSGRPRERFDLLKQGEIIILDEADLTQDYEDIRNQSIRSVMVAPLLYQAELMGTLNLAVTEVGVFTPEHQEIAGQIAGQLAIAIRQTDLRKQTQRHIARLGLQLVEPLVVDLQPPVERFFYFASGSTEV